MTDGKQNFGVLSKLLDVFGLSNKSVGFKTSPKGMLSRGFGHDVNATNVQVGQDWESKRRDWQEMANHDIIQAALNLYSEEATIYEQNAPAIIWPEAENKEIENKLLKLFNNIKSEDHIFSQAWHISAYGNIFEKLESHPGEGIVESVFMPVDEMERIWDERRILLGFRWSGGDSKNKQQLWKPWDFIQFRRLAAQRATEWGESVVEPARSVFKKFSMIESSIITYRLNMNPNRLKLDINTGESDPYNQMRITEDWKRTILANQWVNQKKEQFENIYQPPAFESMLFIPKNSDDSSALDVLRGDNKFPEIADFVLLFKRMAGALGIPPAYLGFEDNVSAKNLLIQEDVRFARKILSIRKPLINGYKRLCEIHLSHLNIDPKKVKFEVKMAQMAPLDAQMRAELLGSQLEIVRALSDLGEAFGLDKASWFRYVFKTYLSLPSDVVELFVQSINTSSLEDSEIRRFSGVSTGMLQEEMTSRNNLKGVSSKKLKEVIDDRKNKDIELYVMMEKVKDLARSTDFLADTDMKRVSKKLDIKRK